MKLIYIRTNIDGISCKVPKVIMSEREKQLYEYQAQKFYSQIGDELDFRIEPYES